MWKFGKRKNRPTGAEDSDESGTRNKSPLDANQTEGGVTRHGPESAESDRMVLADERTSASSSLPVREDHGRVGQASPRGPKRSGERTAYSPKTLILIFSFAFVAVVVALLAFGGTPVTGPPAPTPTPTVTQTPAVQPDDTAVKKAIEAKPAQLRAALTEYAKQSPDIRRILGEGLEAKHIGGAVATAVSNFQKNGGDKFETPEQLGLARIKDRVDAKALVNLALEGTVEIVGVSVGSVPGDEHAFEVTIDVKNKTGKPVAYFIPKGQIVEIKNGLNISFRPSRGLVNVSLGARIFSQSAANSGREYDESDDKVKVIPPWKPEPIKYTAYCANPTYEEPSGAANLAIFALADTSYDDWMDLRSIMIKKLQLKVKGANEPSA